ncbi:dipeptidase [Arthrobacter sp. MYb211]|uniref:dipeptidase n=1 Tax=Micrococcaceae TaxID=1268 RepID=UPI000CFAEB45|nr:MULTISPECIES: dipeptidase [unclassified Arthrobacter]PRA01116.1 dipeptidase [Arthrobacter sp. MYb224]PRA06722.1 dipeptidase [Arthrobacter sp. MYb229]PRA13863.1 dipeptidase [Arthrobacter sp. MYb221]PRB53623.1 dipeptidase [Arthrobacter sp. MYb216]PRC09233.1 dipeptidase [Arthrobacter sp. MYb211]
MTNNSSVVASNHGVDVTALKSHIEKNFEKILKELGSLVAIPGVAWESFDPANLEESAQAVAALARDAGMESVEILREPAEDGVMGAPAVVARRMAQPGKPTVLLYAHHDVQPPGNEEDWNTPAFEATKVGERLYGRGAADDKAGIMVHIASLCAVLDSVADFGVGVTYFFEGEEEAGSPSFRNFLEAHQDKLAADVIVVADSSNWAVGTPALTSSLRGMAAAEITVRSLGHAVHSGMFGGPVLDAPVLAAKLIASFHDENGSVAVPGLVANDIAEVDFDESEFRRDSSVLESVQLAGTGKITDRLWNKPALSVIGMDMPSVDRSSNTLIPQTRFKVSMRLAPGQEPSQALASLEAHVNSVDLRGAEVQFVATEAGSAYQADLEASANGTARWALEQSWGVEPVSMGLGGSIPFIADLLDVFPQAQILVTGVEDPDSRAHSANESLHIGDFQKAIVAEALLLARINSEGL